MVSRIRVPGVPADFRVPPGWPQPTDAWIRANALWSPPTGWRPRPDVPPAPAGWGYWVPNPLWKRVAYGQIPAGRVRRFGFSTIVNVVLVACIALAAVTRIPLFGTAAFLIAITCVAATIVQEIKRSRYDRLLLAEFAVAADRERTRRLTREYQRYLVDAA